MDNTTKMSNNPLQKFHSYIKKTFFSFQNSLKYNWVFKANLVIIKKKIGPITQIEVKYLTAEAQSRKEKNRSMLL